MLCTLFVVVTAPTLLHSCRHVAVVVEAYVRWLARASLPGVGRGVLSAIRLKNRYPLREIWGPSFRNAAEFAMAAAL